MSSANTLRIASLEDSLPNTGIYVVESNSYN